MTRIDHEKENRKKLVVKKWQDSIQAQEVKSSNQAENLQLIEPDQLLNTAKAIFKMQKDVNGLIGDIKFLMTHQLIACSAIVLLGKNRDIRFIRDLLNNIPEIFYRERMQEFFNKFSPIELDEQGVAYFSKLKPVRLGEALETPWWKD